MDVLLDRSGRSAFRSTREYDLHAGDVTALSFSGDGNELTASGLSGKVVALGPRRGGTVHWQQQHSNPVMCCCVSLDGFHRVTGCEDGTLHVYDVSSGRRIHLLQSETGEAVNALDIMIDGRYVVACYGNDVVVWEVMSGEKLCRANDCHAGVVFDVATCPKDARRFATASEDGTAKVWMVSVQKQSFLQLHLMRSNTKTGVSSIAWSPDGRFIATGSSPGGVRIWLAATGTPMAVLGDPDHNAIAIRWSPGSQYVIVIGGTADALIYEPLSKEEPFRLVSHFESVTACAWSRSGNLIATGDAAGTVKIWELIELGHGGRSPAAAAAHGGGPSSAMASNSGSESSDNAYSSEDDETMGLTEAERELNAYYNLILEQEQREADEREREEQASAAAAANNAACNAAKAIAADPEEDYGKWGLKFSVRTSLPVDDDYAAPSSSSASIGTDALGRAVAATVPWGDAEVDRVGVTEREGETVECGDDESASTGEHSFQDRGSGRMPSRFDIDELESTSLPLGNKEQLLRHIDTGPDRKRRGKSVNVCEPDAQSDPSTPWDDAASAAVGPSLAAFRIQEAFVPLIDKLTFEHHVTCCALSSTGRLLVCVRHKHGAYVWNDPLLSRHATFQLQGHRANVLCGAWAPTGGMLVTGSADSSAVVWSLRGGGGGGGSDNDVPSSCKLHARLVLHKSDVLCCAWSPVVGANAVADAAGGGGGEAGPAAGDLLLATGSVDSTVTLWCVRNTQRQSSAGIDCEEKAYAVRQLLLHTLYVRCLAFSHDGTMLYSGSSDKTLRCWATSSGKCLFTTPRRVQNESQTVMAVACSPVEHCIVAGYRNGVARVLDGHSGRVLMSFEGHASEVWSASFSPDGRYVLTTSWDKTARCWSAETGAMLWKENKLHHAGVKSCDWVSFGLGDDVKTNDDGSSGGGGGGRRCEGKINFAVTGGMDRAVYMWEVHDEPLSKREAYTRLENPNTPRSRRVVDFNLAIIESLIEVSTSLETLHISVMKATLYLQQNRSRLLYEPSSISTETAGVAPKDDGPTDVEAEGAEKQAGTESRAILAPSLDHRNSSNHVMSSACSLISHSWAFIRSVSYISASKAPVASPTSAFRDSSSASGGTDKGASSSREGPLSVSYEHMAGCYSNLEKIIVACEEFSALLSESALECRGAAAHARQGDDSDPPPTDVRAEEVNNSEWMLFELSLGVVTKQKSYLKDVLRSLPQLVQA